MTGCDRGLCKNAVGRQDRQLNTYDWLADVPGNTDTTDLVEVQSNHSVFDQLPPAFTLDDLAALKRNDLSRQSLLKIILRWKNDGWVEQVDKQHWKKEDNKTLRQ